MAESKRSTSSKTSRRDQPVANACETITLSRAADPHAARTLTIDHPALLGGLRALPDPAPGGLEDTFAAADLIAVADGSRYDFGRATTADPAAADFVEQVLAVPEELFTTAHRLVGDPYGDPHGDPYGGPHRRKSRNGPEATEAIMRDHVLGAEAFFGHLYTLLADAPPALDPGAGGDVF